MADEFTPPAVTFLLTLQLLPDQVMPQPVLVIGLEVHISHFPAFLCQQVARVAWHTRSGPESTATVT